MFLSSMIHTAVASLAISTCSINCTNEIKFRNIFDDVFADRMNTGLDWTWVEILTVMMDWIGLDWISKKTDPLTLTYLEHTALFQA